MDHSYTAQVANRVMLYLLEPEAQSLPPGYETHLTIWIMNLRKWQSREISFGMNCLKYVFHPTIIGFCTLKFNEEKAWQNFYGFRG